MLEEALAILLSLETANVQMQQKINTFESEVMPIIEESERKSSIRHKQWLDRVCAEGVEYNFCEDRDDE